VALSKTQKLTSKGWEKYFKSANVLVQELDACKSNRAKAIKIGHFLSRNVDRAVTIEVDGRTGRAILRVKAGRSKEKYYYFDVIWDNGATDTVAPQTPNPDDQKVSTQKKGKTEQAAQRSKAATSRKAAKAKPVQTPRGGNAEDW
jgi:hypothetical protein